MRWQNCGEEGENKGEEHVKEDPTICRHERGGRGGGSHCPTTTTTTLSEEALREHTKRLPCRMHHNADRCRPHQAPIKNESERRQFIRPICPKEGRGEYAFFTRVPSAKPIFKSPQCNKTAKRGGGGGGNGCTRLHPIPEGGGEGMR